MSKKIDTPSLDKMSLDKMDCPDISSLEKKVGSFADCSGWQKMLDELKPLGPDVMKQMKGGFTKMCPKLSSAPDPVGISDCKPKFKTFKKWVDKCMCSGERTTGGGVHHGTGPHKSANTGLIIGLAVGIPVLIILGIIMYFLMRK
jgi:hypothetical protein